MIIPPSISGTGAGVSEVAKYEEMNVKGKLGVDSLITVTGDKIYNPELYKAHQANVVIAPVIGSGFLTYYAKLHWTDIMAVALTVQNVGVDKNKNILIVRAGKRSFDKLGMIIIAKEIAQSDGTKDWNSVMKNLNAKDPIPADDTIQPKSPFNPDSIYYNPSKEIFTYDPDNGYIIYKSGEIIWTETGLFL